MAMSRGTQVEVAGGVLLLAGLALTHTLRMLWDLVRVAGRWAAGFVFDPLVWFGVVLGVAGLVLLVVGRRLTHVDAAPAERPAKRRAERQLPPPPPAASGSDDPDIAAVLKKYNIS